MGGAYVIEKKENSGISSKYSQQSWMPLGALYINNFYCLLDYTGGIQLN